MTSEERDLIARFIERVAGAQPSGQPLPPLDPEADRHLADLYASHPEARYRITQIAMVQEHALMEAQNRINRLTWELQQMQQAQQQQQAQPSPWGAPPQPSRGFLSGLFGAAAPPRPAAPPPQYAPPQQPQPQPQYAAPPQQYAPGTNPGMFQPQGSGFLGSALRTAAGVAGGVVAADALMGLFGHHGGGFGGGGWGGGPQTIVEEVPVASPWGAPPTDAYPTDAGDDQSALPTPPTWEPPPDQGGGWQDSSVDPAADQGGWDQPSDDGGGWDDDTQDI